MPQVSETLQKLSDSLAGLSERAKVAEQRAADAQSETREQLESRIAEIKASARRNQDALHARGAKAKDEVTSRWSTLRDEVQEHVAKMRSEIEQRRDDHDAKVAQHRADRAAAYAFEAIDSVQYALDEAEAAVLDANDAQKIADAARAQASGTA